MTRRITVRSGSIARKVAPPASAAFTSGMPTLMVASSTASAALKRAANYVCDGTADEVQIAGAVTELNAAGLTTGRIQLTEGTFFCTDDIWLDDHLLHGVGMNATTLQFDDGPSYNTTGAAIDVGTGGIADLGVWVVTTLASTPRDGINLERGGMVKNIWIDFEPTDPSGTCRSAIFTDRGWVLDSFIIAGFGTANSSAIYCNGTVDDDFGIIANNTIDCELTVDYGVRLIGDGFTVTGNKIHRALVDGVHVPSTGSKHVIVGNNITKAGRDGIRIDGTAGLCLVIGNLIDAAGVDGIHLTANTTDNTIGPNLITGSGGSDIVDNGTNTTRSTGALPVKTDTGDPAAPFEGQIYVNTFDKKVRVYADADWRDLATW